MRRRYVVNVMKEGRVKQDVVESGWECGMLMSSLLWQCYKRALD